MGKTRAKRIRLLAAGVDGFILLTLGIWLAGGIPWGEKTLLRHGADPRRAALLAAIAAAVFATRLREESRFARLGRRAWQALETSSVWRWRLLAAVCAWAVGLGVLQGLALRYALYDVGIFHQLGWNLAHGHGFQSTVSGAGDFLRDHLSYSLALLTPFYWLGGSSPLLLPVLQPLLIFGGAAAWLWLAERLPGADAATRGRVAAATAVFAVGFDSLWGNLRWGFHETSIAFAALSWAWALVLGHGSVVRRRAEAFALCLGCVGVAALSKEILLVDVGLACLVAAFVAGREEEGLPAASVALGAVGLALLAAFAIFEISPHPADKNYFERYYSYLGTGLRDFFSGLLFSPWKVVEAVGAGELLRYVKTVFLPWLFLPLAWWVGRGTELGRWRLIAAASVVPSFASAALATYPPLRGPGFHYVLELWPALACLTVLTLGAVARRDARIGRGLCVAWALSAVVLLDQDPWGQARQFLREAREQGMARQALASIPVDRSVAATELAGPWVSGRRFVTRWPELSLIPERGCPDWVVLKAGEIPAGLLEPKGCCGGMDGTACRIPYWNDARWAVYRLR